MLSAHVFFNLTYFVYYTERYGIEHLDVNSASMGNQLMMMMMKRRIQYISIFNLVTVMGAIRFVSKTNRWCDLVLWDS